MEDNNNCIRTSGQYNFTLSVASILANAFSIYPNPADNTLTIEAEELGGVYFFTDLTGKTLKTGVLNTGGVTTLDLTAGLYLVRITTNNGQTLTRKIIKQ